MNRFSRKNLELSIKCLKILKQVHNLFINIEGNGLTYKVLWLYG